MGDFTPAAMSKVMGIAANPITATSFEVKDLGNNEAEITYIGATSRVIAYATGAIFIVLGFFPKISTLLAVMPAPVAGAVLVFSACYMFMSGLQIITSEKLDYRRTFEHRSR